MPLKIYGLHLYPLIYYKRKKPQKTLIIDLDTFILDNIESGSTIATDDWQSYNIIDKEQFRREITNQSKSKDYEKLYGAHLVTTLIKRLTRGTYQGDSNRSTSRITWTSMSFDSIIANPRASAKSSCESFSRR